MSCLIRCKAILPKDAQVDRCVTATRSTAIYVKYNIQVPVKAVLNAPVSTDQGVELAGIKLSTAGEIIPCLRGGYLTGRSLGSQAYELANQAPSLRKLRTQIPSGGYDLTAPGLIPAVVVFSLLILGLDAAVAKGLLYLFAQVSLVTLERQNVVSFGLHDLIGNLVLTAHGVDADGASSELEFIE